MNKIEITKMQLSSLFLENETLLPQRIIKIECKLNPEMVQNLNDLNKKTEDQFYVDFGKKIEAKLREVNRINFESPDFVDDQNLSWYNI